MVSKQIYNILVICVGEIIPLPFASDQNFLDPALTSDGRPYAPVKFEQIVEERYQISKHINTSYVDLGKVSPAERKYLLHFIKRDIEHENKLIEEKTAQMKGNK